MSAPHMVSTQPVTLLACGCGGTDWTFADQEPAMWLATDNADPERLLPKRTVQIRPNGLECARCGALMSERV